jgi:hypothetical protein
VLPEVVSGAGVRPVVVVHAERTNRTADVAAKGVRRSNEASAGRMMVIGWEATREVRRAGATVTSVVVRAVRMLGVRCGE